MLMNVNVTNNLNVLGQVTNTVDSARDSVTNWFNNHGLANTLFVFQDGPLIPKRTIYMTVCGSFTP
jgi:hypothetical protein